MLRSGLERGHNAAIPARIKRADCWDSRTSHTTYSFRTSNTSPTYRERAKSKKTLCAPRWAAKGLGCRATLALPDVPDAPAWNTVLTASSDHLKQATYSPFDCRHSTTDERAIQPSVI